MATTATQFPVGVWVVEGGALKTVPGAKDPVDIITKDKYKDFELELEWKISTGGNSGIIYRVAELPAPSQTYQTGPEMQVLDDDEHKDGKDPRTSAGALYALIAATNKTLKPVGEWNKARIVVKGGQVEHWLNGAKVVGYEWGSAEVKDLIAASKFKEWPRFATRPRATSPSSTTRRGLVPERPHPKPGAPAAGFRSRAGMPVSEPCPPPRRRALLRLLRPGPPWSVAWYAGVGDRIQT